MKPPTKREKNFLDAVRREKENNLEERCRTTVRNTGAKDNNPKVRWNNKIVPIYPREAYDTPNASLPTSNIIFELQQPSSDSTNCESFNTAVQAEEAANIEVHGVTPSETIQKQAVCNRTMCSANGDEKATEGTLSSVIEQYLDMECSPTHQLSAPPSREEIWMNSYL